MLLVENWGKHETARLYRAAHARSHIQEAQRHFRWVGAAIEKANRAEIMFDVLVTLLFILSILSYFGFPAMPWFFGARWGSRGVWLSTGFAVVILLCFFSNIVLGCMRCLWAGRDSHLSAGADLDCFGIAYGHFGGGLSSASSSSVILRRKVLSTSSITPSVNCCWMASRYSLRSSIPVSMYLHSLSSVSTIVVRYATVNTLSAHHDQEIRRQSPATETQENRDCAAAH